ncbi:MAG: hypothetical protein GDA44_11645 [Prochloron sp. SP5CPC1]|nr:hypothetical protein [Candidatus Paraprochloron terpiosi SP5CPC1]
MPKTIIKISILKDYGKVYLRSLLNKINLPRLNLSATATANENQPILSLHHQACTGGSIISKYFNDYFSNLVLISEINPKATFGSYRFSPLNPLSQYAYQSGEPWHYEAFQKKIYIHEISLINKDISSKNSYLLIRDWSHGDFFSFTIISETTTVNWLTDAGFSVIPIVTVRHPLESYLSARAKKWVDMSLHEYCERYHSFFKVYAACPVFYYEDFCRSPEDFFSKIINYYKDKGIHLIKNSGYSPHRAGSKKISGDSGRSASLPYLRSAKPIPNHLANTTKSTSAYLNLCTKLGYNPYLQDSTTQYFKP